jgi:hypothetical protein
MIVDRIVPMERDSGGLTHGEVIEQLVLNRLNDPQPLVHIEDWAEHTGILELCHIRPEQLNDDRLGDALEARQTPDQSRSHCEPDSCDHNQSRTTSQLCAGYQCLP